MTKSSDRSKLSSMKMVFVKITRPSVPFDYMWKLDFTRVVNNGNLRQEK